jgi:hypothetical protein
MRTRRQQVSDALAYLADLAAGAAWTTLDDGEVELRIDGGPNAEIEAVTRRTWARLLGGEALEHEELVVVAGRTFLFRARRLSSFHCLGVLVRDDAYRPPVDRLFAYLARVLLAPGRQVILTAPDDGTPPSGAPALLALGIRGPGRA